MNLDFKLPNKETRKKEISRIHFDEFHTPNYTPQNKVIVSGKGSYVIGQDGKEYVDFAAGIAVNCTDDPCYSSLSSVTNQQ